MLSSLFDFGFFFEKQNKIKQYGQRHIDRNEPDLFPLMMAIDRVVIGGEAGNPGADKHSHSISGEGEKPLRSAFDFFTGFLFRIHVAGHKKEIVANSVQDDPGVQHPKVVLDISIGKANIAEDPGGHTEKQHFLYAYTIE